MVAEFKLVGLDIAMILLPIFIIALAARLYHQRYTSRAVSMLADRQHQSLLLFGYSSWRNVIRLIMFSVALFAVFMIVLQPQWGEIEEAVTHEGRDILVAIDISRSMLAEDFSPSRLEFTKLKVQTLLDRLGPERVALLIFSGAAFLQCPFTSDFGAFKLFLSQIDAETVSSGSTAIDLALAKAVEVFNRTPGRKHRIMLMFTDGEDFSSNIEPSIARAHEVGVTLMALGIGTTEGAPVPRLGFGGERVGHEMNPDGTVALTKLNEELLKKMASRLNGEYLRVTYDDSDVEKIISMVERFEKEKIEDRTVSHLHDRYPWFAGAAGILFALEWLL